jgi:hypothetical protein
VNDPCEIPTDLGSDDLAERLERAFQAAGWIVGANEDTPHQGSLLYRPRTRSPSYELAGVAATTERAVIAAVAREHGGRIAYVGDGFCEWEAGQLVVCAEPGGGGGYRGVSWDQLRAGADAPPGMPRDLVAAVRAPSGPDLDAMIDVLIDHLYGAPIEEEESPYPILEVHHPFDATWLEALEPLFLRVRGLLTEQAEVEVPGLVSFRRLDGDGGELEAVSRAGASLVRAVEEGAPLAIDVAPVLGGDDREVVQALEEACARLRRGGADILVGADLALHASVAPDDRVVPVFIGW